MVAPGASPAAVAAGFAAFAGPFFPPPFPCLGPNPLSRKGPSWACGGSETAEAKMESRGNSLVCCLALLGQGIGDKEEILEAASVAD